MTTGSDKSMRDSCFRFCYLPVNYALNDVPSSDHPSESPAFPEPQVRSYGPGIEISTLAAAMAVNLRFPRRRFLCGARAD